MPQIRSVSLPSCVVSEVKSEPNIVVETSIHPDFVHILVPVDLSGGYRVDGIQAGTGSFFVTPGGTSRISAGARRHAFGLCLQRRKIARTLAALRGVGETEVVIKHGELLLPDLAMGRLQTRLSAILDLAASQSADPTDWKISELLSDELTTIALDYYLCATQVSARSARTAQTATRIVRKAEEYFMDRLRMSVSLADLCKAAGVSADALALAFKSVCNETPMRYFKRRRLSIAHANLRKEKTQRSVIKRIAIDAGLTELGRFSAEYRSIYGELPSSTLQRDADPFPYPD